MKSLQPRAFTLIELLIAVAIFAMVLLAINGVFYGAMRLRSKTTRMIDASLPIQQTVAIIKRDLQGIVAPGGVLAGPLTSGMAASSASRMTPQGSTEIYTCTGLLDEISPWADVQKVAYYLRNPTNQATAFGKDLMRAVTRNLLATVEEQPMEQWLMGEVERVALFFYDGTSWRDSWDSTAPDSATGQTNMLPKAIKVQIELAETDVERRNRSAQQNKTPVEIVVPIFAQSRGSQTQNTGGQQ